MNNNYQRAIETLNEHWGVAKETGMADETECCVKALEDAGLLMPDLTEPRVFRNGEKEWTNPDGWINLEDGTITIFYDERCSEEPLSEDMEPEPAMIYATNPTQLRWLALDMLAAANYAEKGQTDGNV